MKLYDGGAIILIILALALVGWSYDADKLESIEDCHVVQVEPQSAYNPFSWFGKGK